MTTRTDFSPEQWQAIRNAPQLVAPGDRSRRQ